MKLAPSAEQSAFEDGLRRALAGLPADDADAQWRHLADLGVTGLGIPEEHGGSGGGRDEIAIAARVLGEAGWRTPFAGTVGFAASVLAGGMEGDCTGLLREIAAGALRVAPVVAEWQPGFGVQRTEAGYRLSGNLSLVPDGGWADAFLIDAVDPAGMRMALWMRADTPGLSVKPVPVVDGSLAADLECDGVVLPLSACLAEGAPAAAAMDGAAALYQVARTWETAAAIGELVRMTCDHVRTREQFGQPLSGFQVIQHRVARMSVLAAEARAAAAYAQAECAVPPRRRNRALSSAFIRIVEIGEHIAREAVQLHGAIGFTEECGISRPFKAVFAFAHEGCGLAWHKRRLATIMREMGEAGRSLACAPQPECGSDGMSLDLTPEEEAFRQGVDTFVAGALDDELRRGARLAVGVFPEPDVAGPWHRKLCGQGWIAPYLPPEAGGTGWTPVQAYLFEHACARGGAPSLQLQGLRMLAPVLLHYGTPEQVARYLPGILSGDDLWCQGYSEPGAGSDLAALRTRAVADGEDYIVNGSKIWTTQAQHASHMFALVRTSQEGRRQEGISFLLIDMATPGIEVRPIRTLAGELEFNEVFFDNVRVPRANLLGVENGGWECAKYLLDFERGGSTVSGPLRAYFARAVAALKEGDDTLDERLASVAAALDALEMGELLAMAQTDSAAPGHVAASALKLRMAEVRQQIGALAADALGRDALRWPMDRPLHHQPVAGFAEEWRGAIVPNHFNDLAYSIFAGSSEIQLSIIASALGLRGGRK